MKSIDIETLRTEIEDFKAKFCPYGYLDIQSAVRDALEAGFDVDWAFGQMEQFSEECGMKLSAIDPCYVVMDAILQQARNEIEEISGFDLQNDAGYETYGNFMGSCYMYLEEDTEILTALLKRHAIYLGKLSDAAKWFLSAVEIDLYEILKGETEEEADDVQH